jgi:hypothetical protein
LQCSTQCGSWERRLPAGTEETYSFQVPPGWRRSQVALAKETVLPPEKFLWNRRDEQNKDH